MIPKIEAKNVIQGGGVDDSVSFDISSDDVAHIMVILRDTLYSDRILAVIREYCTNAWDANVMAGKGDVPIKVTLPIAMFPEFVVRDYGLGLTHEDVRNIYTKYGSSTKRSSNDAAGMLGIGSKSAFAYSDSFTITTWNQGQKRIYIAALSDNKGKCDLVHSEPCDVSETGTEVKITASVSDIAAFKERAEKVFKFWHPKPNINIELPAAKNYEKVGDLGAIDLDRGTNDGWYAIMGPVAYQIDLNQVGFGYGHAAKLTNGYVNLNIGDAQVAASREHLKYGVDTNTILKNKIEALIEKFCADKLVEISSFSNWKKRIILQKLNSIKSSVPAHFRDLIGNSVRIKDSIERLQLTCRTFTKSWGRSTKSSFAQDYIDIGAETRFVIKTDSKSINHYVVNKHDYIISEKKSTKVDFWTAKSLLDKVCVDLKIDGIDIVDINTLPIDPSHAKSATPKIPKQKNSVLKSKSSVLVFDDAVTNASSLSKSDFWKVEQHTVSDDDLYVVLNNFNVEGIESFSSLRLRHLSYAKELGIALPKIIGYRSTKASPIDKSKLKGKEYTDWVKSGGLFDVVKKNPTALQLINDYAYYQNWSPEISKTNFESIANKLRQNNAVLQFLQKSCNGYSNHCKLNPSHSLRSALAFFADSANERTTLWKELQRKYEMLNLTEQIQFMYEMSTPKFIYWVNYFNLVDSV